MKDKHGKVLTKEQNQLDEWEEQFGETLNRPDPDVEAVIEYMGFEIEMTRGNITQQEIEKAIRQTKGNRAPGKDRVTARHVEGRSFYKRKSLRKLFNKVWEEEKCPNMSSFRRELTSWCVATGEASTFRQCVERSSVEFSYRE